jgi:hypothetical protein
MSTLLLVPHALPHQECASPDERLLKDEGTQRRRHGLPLVPLRPQRVKRLLEPLCTPPNRSAAERPCACRPQRKPVLQRWRREGACLQEDSVRRSTAPCAHNQPRSPRSHEVRVRSARSCLTQLARLNLAAGRQSARRRSHALISGHRRPPPASRSAYDTAEGDRPRHPDKSICVVCRSFKEIGVMQHTEYQARGCICRERLALGASSPSVCEAPMSPCRGGA